MRRGFKPTKNIEHTTSGTMTHTKNNNCKRTKNKKNNNYNEQDPLRYLNVKLLRPIYSLMFLIFRRAQGRIQKMWSLLEERLLCTLWFFLCKKCSKLTASAGIGELSRWLCGTAAVLNIQVLHKQNLQKKKKTQTTRSKAKKHVYYCIIVGAMVLCGLNNTEIN